LHKIFLFGGFILGDKRLIACVGKFEANREKFLEYCMEIGGDSGRIMGEEGVIVAVRRDFPKYVILFNVIGNNGRFIMVTDRYFVRKEFSDKIKELSDCDDKLIKNGLKKKLFSYSVAHLVGEYPFVNKVKKVEVFDNISVNKLPELVRLGVKELFGVEFGD